MNEIESTIDPTVIEHAPVVEELPDQEAELAEDENLEDEGTTYSEELPGEDDPIDDRGLPRILAQRVSLVSDTILLGHSQFPPDSAPQILVPRHRDRLRVTIQCVIDTGTEPPVYLGRGPDLRAGEGYEIVTDDPLVFETRAPIYAVTGSGTGSVNVQWAAELMIES